MIHYNVWFTIKDEIPEGTGLAIVEDFLRELSTNSTGGRYRLLKNISESPPTKLPRYQAIVEFESDYTLSEVIKSHGDRAAKVRAGRRVVDVVSEFQIEAFRFLEERVDIKRYACTI